MSYKHEALPSARHIRVLDLQPSREETAPIQVTLRQLDLDSKKTKKSYEAFPYVWGYRMPDIPIVCDGKELLITSNCRDALMRLRKTSSTKEMRNTPSSREIQAGL
jgi:hypothetical protein